MLVTKQHVQYDPSSSVAEIHALTLSLLSFPLSSPARPGTAGLLSPSVPCTEPSKWSLWKGRSLSFPSGNLPTVPGTSSWPQVPPFPAVGTLALPAVWPLLRLPNSSPHLPGWCPLPLEACLSVMDSEKPFLTPGLNWNPLFSFFHYSGSSLHGVYQNLFLCV